MNWNFNSIKVQLKLHLLNVSDRVLRFQFHKGTIKTRNLLRAVRLSQAFQFHKGTIKTSAKLPNFIQTSEFQFHKGTIKTGNLGAPGGRWDISIP